MERQFLHISVQKSTNINTQTHYQLHIACSKHRFGEQRVAAGDTCKSIDDERGTCQEAVHTSRKCAGGQSPSPPFFWSILACSLLRFSMLKLPELSARQCILTRRSSGEPQLPPTENVAQSGCCGKGVLSIPINLKV